MKTNPRRHGFTLMLVLIFLVLLLSIWSLSYRQLSSALRIQTLRSQFATRDQGSLEALAQGVSLLTGGSPPTNPYVCGVTIIMPAGPTSYTLTFSSLTPNVWTVDSALTPPGVSVDPMPGSFAPPSG